MKLLSNIFILVFIIFLAANSIAEVVFTVNAPSGWEVKYNRFNNTDHYAISVQLEKKALLMISNDPNIEKNEILNEQNETIKYFQEQLDIKYKNDLTVIKVETQKIYFKQFKGSSIIVHHKDGFILSLFSIYCEDTIIIGQFNGHEKHWAEVVKIIETIEYKG